MRITVERGLVGNVAEPRVALQTSADGSQIIQTVTCEDLRIQLAYSHDEADRAGVGLLKATAIGAAIVEQRKQSPIVRG